MERARLRCVWPKSTVEQVHADCYFVNSERAHRTHKFQRGESHGLITRESRATAPVAGYIGTRDVVVPEQPKL